MELAGRVDPTKVVRIALENAVSVASILLLTEATMTELPAKEKPLPAEAAEYQARRDIHLFPPLKIVNVPFFHERPAGLNSNRRRSCPTQTGALP